MHYARTASKVREQIIKFSGELSSGWPKVARRFLAETIYGIQARQSVHLTEIARALGEKIPIKKTQYRLCRQLGREDLGRKVLNGLSRMGGQRVEKRTLLIMDISDIRKKYARRMEHLARVRERKREDFGQRVLDHFGCRSRSGKDLTCPALWIALLPEESGLSKREHRDSSSDKESLSSNRKERGVGYGPRGRPGLYFRLSAQQ